VKDKRPFFPLQLTVHLFAWLPLVWLVWAFWQDRLGFNPVRALTLRTGKTALVLLLLSLAVTPVYLLTGWKGVYRVRRPLGLYAFMYATIHFLIFVGLDYGFDLALVGEALRTNRFTYFGLTSFLLLLPLALTSSRGAAAWLGQKRWRQLHRLSYLAAALAIVHFALLVRQYYVQPIIFGSILAVLLGLRALFTLFKRQRA